MDESEDVEVRTMRALRQLFATSPSERVELCQHFVFDGFEYQVPAGQIFTWAPVETWTLKLCQQCAYDLRTRLNDYADSVVHTR